MKRTPTRLLVSVCLTIIPVQSLQGEETVTGTKSVAYHELQSKVQILGKLGLPLGEKIRISGEVFQSRAKAYAHQITLKVLSINGEDVEENHPEIVLRSEFSSWLNIGIEEKYLQFPKRNEPDDPDPDQTMNPFADPFAGATIEFHPAVGTVLECVGYESGGFVGVPQAVYDDVMPRATTRFHFHVNFYAIKAKVVTGPKVEPKTTPESSEQAASSDE